MSRSPSEHGRRARPAAGSSAAARPPLGDRDRRRASPVCRPSAAGNDRAARLGVRGDGAGRGDGGRGPHAIRRRGRGVRARLRGLFRRQPRAPPRALARAHGDWSFAATGSNLRVLPCARAPAGRRFGRRRRARRRVRTPRTGMGRASRSPSDALLRADCARNWNEFGSRLQASGRLPRSGRTASACSRAGDDDGISASFLPAAVPRHRHAGADRRQTVATTPSRLWAAKGCASSRARCREPRSLSRVRATDRTRRRASASATALHRRRRGPCHGRANQSMRLRALLRPGASARTASSTARRAHADHHRRRRHLHAGADRGRSPSGSTRSASRLRSSSRPLQ